MDVNDFCLVVMNHNSSGYVEVVYTPKGKVSSGENVCFCLFTNLYHNVRKYLGDSYFEFKIRLIRLGLSFQEQKFMYLNSQATDSQSRVISITPKSQL